MSVFYNFKIAPVSNTVTTLEDIAKFIANLRDKNFVEKEFMILSGNKEDIMNIDDYCFYNGELVKTNISNSPSLPLVSNLDGIEKLDKNKNYAFKLSVSKSCEIFAGLDVFEMYPNEKTSLFLLFLSESISLKFFSELTNNEEKNYEEEEEDDEIVKYEEINIENINSFIKNSGRAGNNLYGLQENQNDYEAFFKEIEFLYENYILDSYYD